MMLRCSNASHTAPLFARKRLGWIILSAASTLFLPSVLSANANAASSEQTLNKSDAVISNNAKKSAASQRKINTLDDARNQRFDEYRTIKAEIDQLDVYNQQMSAIVASQQQDLASLDTQISEIETTERGVLPLMQRMIATLDDFTAQDTPFLKNERATRIAKLKALMSSADSTVSEKFRRVLEAYQIEVDYGRNVEAYRAKENDTTFDFLRIGRLALYKFSNDGRQAWLWQPNTQQWSALESEHLRDLKKALKVAQKVLAPQLMIVPVPTPSAAAASQGGAS